MRYLMSLRTTKGSVAIYLMDCFVILFLAMTMLLVSSPVLAVGLGSPCENDSQCAPLICSPRDSVCDVAEPTTITSPRSNSGLGTINPPEAIKNLGYGSIGLSRVLTNAVQIIYIVAGIVFLFMIIIGAFQWIVSGGDKEKVANARSRITNAIIGIFLLAIAFIILRVIGQLTGFEFFSGQNNPITLPSASPTQFVLPPTENLTVEEYERRNRCNQLASQGFRWNQVTKQCESQ